MPRILLTGFEPFGGETINPSMEAIKQLNLSSFPSEIFFYQVPVAFYDSSKFVIEKIHELRPDIIIMIGQAGGRKDISVERIAINLDDSQVPDNNGVLPKDDPISIFGESGYFSTLPVKSIVENISKVHIPCHISNSAGTYVCNHLFYSVMHELHERSMNHVKAGFIHVPYIKEQVVHRSHLFSLETHLITQAIDIAIRTTLDSLSIIYKASYPARI
ncbi:MAG: pyroglutamyl-peptidase I [Acholeplasma sp.]|jgi:pyroglutamyl-peptidase|nr:MAG: pyroglutamyl-peptidase I [Acholeplasma sp.]